MFDHWKYHFIQTKTLLQENNCDIFAVSESWLNSTVSNAKLEIEDLCYHVFLLLFHLSLLLAMSNLKLL